MKIVKVFLKPIYNVILKIRLLRFILMLFYFIKGIVYFYRNRETPVSSYRAMRQLYSLTDGRFNDFISWIQSFRHPRYLTIKSSGILGELCGTEVKKISDKIKESGYYIASKKLDLETIDRIVEFCKKNPAEVLKTSTVRRCIFAG